MRNRPDPTSLYSAALKRAHEDLAYRQRELRTMRASLVILDEIAPTLASHGFELWPHYLTWWPSQRAITVSLGLFCSKQRYAGLFHALIGMGFKVVSHRNVFSFSEAVLKRGRLALRLNDLPLIPSAPEAPTKTADEGAAE